MGTIERGTKRYWQINWAFFTAGFVTFVTLYDVQPLLPVFAKEFQVPAALASLPLSVATAALAVTMLIAGTLSETLGRKRVMVAALVVTSLLALLTAFSSHLPTLLLLRLLQGAALAGLPAVAMAYLSEEIAPDSLASAMGLYISGNAIGGMTGRIGTAIITEYVSWQVALGSIGLLCLALSIYFAWALPPSAHFTRRPFAAKYLFTSLRQQLRDPGLVHLYGVAFLLMGSFVTLYNYITFRLLAPPFSLGHSQVSLVFLVYLAGSFTSSIAGSLARRFGRIPVLRANLAVMALGALITLSGWLPLIVVGIGLFTCGFFGTHTLASGWVGLRAKSAKAQAAALYLFFYYLGSSISGTVGGFFWTSMGWRGVTGMIVALVCGGYVLVERLAALPEPAAARVPEAAVREAV
ncbi:MFS transporter [Geomesophilobacter sediminis]|uniref:MFS transporter n=1 Tax=Geomesophilobacter sediminis TaxID=2798584 RepID=A0A8J7J7B9_9BACT|nr:MFS transporter [Geomesophilobacter sediminis]MBJ6725036.1 MFS transporter [Geomesophilobacter sediminis]